MKCFTLVAQAVNQTVSIENVSSFVGRDTSGSFGLQAGHEHFMTCLEPGVAWFRNSEGAKSFIAQSGAVLIFADNSLTLATTQFIVADDYEQLLTQLEQQWLQQDKAVVADKHSIVQIEQAMARKILAMNKQGERL